VKSSYKTYNKDCYKLLEIKTASIDSLITDPPYGISYQNNYWDKDLPNKEIWENSFRVLKPGAYGLVFSSIRLMHRLMVDLEDSGFKIKDVLMWGYLNGMPKSRNIGLDIDKELNIESEIIGEYNYVQGYKKDGAESYKASKPKKKPKSKLGLKYNGAGLGIKPAYEPIILIQKPITEKTIVKNIIKNDTGALNLEETRIPYEEGEKKVGHNPHPKGRVIANVLRVEKFNDGYDKYFLVPKVRQNKDDFNSHPTIKPVDLIQQLIKLISFEEQIVLDPFAGSGTTGVACLETKRKFIGYEIEQSYFEITNKRLEQVRSSFDT